MGTQKKVLVIGKVWPEPNSSAAGLRILQLIDFFQSKDFEVDFCSAAVESSFSEDISNRGIKTHSIELNNSSFNEFIKEVKPDVVVFDRFMTEEQFGWRVSKELPQSIRILDTEDLHFLRDARRVSIKKFNDLNHVDLHTDLTKREISSIYRCDLSLIISKVEIELLKSRFKIPSDLIEYVPLASANFDKQDLAILPAYDERKHIVSIGNFLHEPNWDSVTFLKNEIWPVLKSHLQDVEIHIYGAYPSQKVFDLHNEKEGFLIKGRADSVEEMLSNARILLAPLRFGAGLKGKLLDAMKAGTPSVTTSIGAEGMIDDMSKWPGVVADRKEDIIESVTKLYSDEDLWNSAQVRIPNCISTTFSTSKPWENFDYKLQVLMNNIEKHRNEHFVGQILMHNQYASTKFMSKWIEEKNKRK